MHAHIYYITRAVERWRKKESEKMKSTWQSICGGDTQRHKNAWPHIRGPLNDGRMLIYHYTRVH